jgi:CPA1 family monovalent cation:H+ antiporter
VTEALQILGLVVAVAVVAASARRLGLSAPLVLTVVGLLASFVPGVPDYQVSPEVVLIGFLPPLLYAAAIRTSLVDVRQNREAIGILAIGAVVFTTLGVGLVAWRVIPGVGIAAALALGAIVSPPDAVAATTIARRVNMPRRIVSILEGESLLNDATALVALRTSAAAIATTVSIWTVGLDFVLAAGGGVVVGLVMSFLLAKAGWMTWCSIPRCPSSRRSSRTSRPRPSMRVACSPSSSSVCCSGTRRPRCSRRRPAWPSRPTGGPSPSSSRTPSSC